MFFLTPNRNMFAGKFVNWESFLAVFWEHIIFNFKRVEIRKMSEVFWAKLYCKMSDLFRWFLLALRFSATNSGIKKTLMMSTGTCALRLYARKNIFKKRITNMRFWIIYILVQVSPALGRFSQCFFFLIFVDGQPWRPTILLMRPTIKKLPTALRQHAFKEMTILCSVRLICGCFVAY